MNDYRANSTREQTFNKAQRSQIDQIRRTNFAISPIWKSAKIITLFTYSPYLVICIIVYQQTILINYAWVISCIHMAWKGSRVYIRMEERYMTSCCELLEVRLLSIVLTSGVKIRQRLWGGDKDSITELQSWNKPVKCWYFLEQEMGTKIHCFIHFLCLCTCYNAWSKMYIKTSLLLLKIYLL